MYIVFQDNFATLTHLISLDLSKNSLTELPENFGSLSLLQRIDLYSNKLKGLPLSFAQLKQLKWLDLKGNLLEAELAEVAGTCVDEKECKECAQKVRHSLMFTEYGKGEFAISKSSHPKKKDTVLHTISFCRIDLKHFESSGNACYSELCIYVSPGYKSSRW